MEGWLLFKERAINGAWRSGFRKTVRTEDMFADCLKMFILNFVVFLVLLGNALARIWKISSSVTTKKQECQLVVACKFKTSTFNDHL